MKRAIRFLAAAGLAGVVSLSAYAAPPNDFRFSIVGDRTGNADEKAYEEIWREIGREHPDFAINAGDTIQGGNDATADAEWQQMRLIWQHYHFPFYLTPGNHDIWSEQSRRNFEKQTGHSPAYSFNFQNAHFTILDNSASLDLNRRQMQFLEQDLEQNKDRSPKFVFFHQPFWLIPLMFGSGDFPFHRLIRNYNVNYVVSGHGHQLVRMERDGIVYLEAGSSGGKLKGQGFAQGWFYQHSLAQVKGLQVAITIKEIGPPFGQGRTINAADWTGQGPKT